MSSKLDQQSPHELRFSNQYINLLKPNDDDQAQWDLTLDIVVRVTAYVVILAFLGMIVTLIMKLLGSCDGTDPTGEQDIAANETNRLLPKEATPITYGTCKEDMESGDCCSSSSSLEDLFNEKICVVCYDRQRNCFFVPCGHCATCCACAKRIFYGENKTCPVCRRLIRKVRQLFTS